MSFSPLVSAPVAVQIHVALALLSLLVGPVVLLRRRRDRLHTSLGYLWVAAMTGTALSSLWITGFAVVGPFGPIHLFVIPALWWLWRGVQLARSGDVAAHRGVFTNLYWSVLIVAGGLSFLPGRMLNEMVFPAQPGLGYGVIAAAGLAMAWATLRGPRRRLGRAKGV